MKTTEETSTRLLLTDEEMRVLSTVEILDRVEKLLEPVAVYFPGLKESGEQMARQLEASWSGTADK